MCGTVYVKYGFNLKRIWLHLSGKTCVYVKWLFLKKKLKKKKNYPANLWLLMLFSIWMTPLIWFSSFWNHNWIILCWFCFYLSTCLFLLYLLIVCDASRFWHAYFVNLSVVLMWWGLRGNVWFKMVLIPHPPESPSVCINDP